MSSDVFPNGEKEAMEVMAMGVFKVLFYLNAKVAKFYAKVAMNLIFSKIGTQIKRIGQIITDILN
jgi:hypothetical protein